LHQLTGLKHQFIKTWFSLSQQIDSMVIHAIDFTSFYLKVGWLVFALSHADEKT